MSAELTKILHKQGYALAAAEHMAQSPIIAAGASEHATEQRFNAIANNYYLQYLALQLETYGVSINQFDAPAQLLQQADHLICGKLGNAPMDSTAIVRLLEGAVIRLRKMHHVHPITWETLYAFRYAPRADHKILGRDLIHALLRSNGLHNGTRATHYTHNYFGMTFSTLSMHECMEMVLEETTPSHLEAINRYGQTVSPMAIHQLRAIARAHQHLKPPVFHDFYHINAHRQISLKISALFRAISGNHMNLDALTEVNTALHREPIHTQHYPLEWQRFLEEITIWLEAIATPYFAKAQAA